MPHPRRGNRWSFVMMIMCCALGTVIEASGIDKAAISFTSTREYKSDNVGKCIMPIGQVLCVTGCLASDLKHLLYSRGRGWTWLCSRRGTGLCCIVGGGAV